jgi:hypothetical protein
VISEEGNPTEVNAKSRAEAAREEALAVTRGAASAIEAEASSLKELEQALLDVDEAIEEVASAVEAEAWARSAMSQAQNRAKEAFINAENASRSEARANKDRDKKEDRLRAEEARAAKAERNGKEPNRTSLDAARQSADEASLKAVTALREAEQAREKLAAANAEVKEAQERAAQASARTYAAKEAEASAKREAAEAGHLARTLVNEANRALELQSSAKKAMDWTIRKVKPLRLYVPMMPEDEVAAPTEMGLERQPREADGDTTGVEESLLPVTEKAIVDAVSVNGVVRLLIAGPVDHSSVRRLQERLDQSEGFRVRSVGGDSSAGAIINVSAEQPESLLAWLRSLDGVERVSKRGRHLEVTLRPAGPDAQMPEHETNLDELDEPVVILS